MNCLSLLGAAPALLVCASPLALGASVTIADLAPPQAIVVVGVDDFGAMRTAMDATTLDGLLAEPTVQQWLKAVRESENSPIKGLEDKLKGVDTTLTDIGWPAGMVGFALWAEFDREADDYLPRWILAADYADGAEKLDGIIEELVEQGLKDGSVELKEEEIDDIAVRSITVNKPKAADEQGLDDEEDNAPATPTVVHQARVGSVMVLAGDMATLERAVDRLKGDNLPSVADDPDFTRALGQVGSRHIYGAVMAKPLMKFVNDLYERGQAGHDNGFADFPIAPGRLVEALGLGDVTSVSMGGRFDADGAVFETRAGLASATKKGLLALMNVSGDAFTPPAFVGADTASLSMMRVDFKGIIPLLQQVVAAMPEEAQQQMGAMIAFATAQAAPLLQTIGPDITIVSRYERPFSANSEKQLIAVRAGDGATVAAILNQFAPQAGLAARDFEGFQIWEAQPEAGSPTVIGLGGGQAFMGPKEMVEEALRAASRPDALKLADEPEFKRAASRVSAGANGYSFAALRPIVEHARWMIDNYEAVVRAELEPYLKDPEIDQEMVKEWLARALEDAKPDDIILKMPPPEVILRHIGDTVGEWRATPDGYRSRWILLAPERK